MSTTWGLRCEADGTTEVGPPESHIRSRAGVPLLGILGSSAPATLHRDAEERHTETVRDMERDPGKT